MKILKNSVIDGVYGANIGRWIWQAENFESIENKAKVQETTVNYKEESISIDKLHESYDKNNPQDRKQLSKILYALSEDDISRSKNGILPSHLNSNKKISLENLNRVLYDFQSIYNKKFPNKSLNIHSKDELFRALEIYAISKQVRAENEALIQEINTKAVSYGDIKEAYSNASNKGNVLTQVNDRMGYKGSDRIKSFWDATTQINNDSELRTAFAQVLKIQSADSSRESYIEQYEKSKSAPLISVDYEKGANVTSQMGDLPQGVTAHVGGNGKYIQLKKGNSIIANINIQKNTMVIVSENENLLKGYVSRKEGSGRIYLERENLTGGEVVHTKEKIEDYQYKIDSRNLIIDYIQESSDNPEYKFSAQLKDSMETVVGWIYFPERGQPQLNKDLTDQAYQAVLNDKGEVRISINERIRSRQEEEKLIRTRETEGINPQSCKMDLPSGYRYKRSIDGEKYVFSIEGEDLLFKGDIVYNPKTKQAHFKRAKSTNDRYEVAVVASANMIKLERISTEFVDENLSRAEKAHNEVEKRTDEFKQKAEELFKQPKYQEVFEGRKKQALEEFRASDEYAALEPEKKQTEERNLVKNIENKIKEQIATDLKNKELVASAPDISVETPEWLFDSAGALGTADHFAEAFQNFAKQSNNPQLIKLIEQLQNIGEVNLPSSGVLGKLIDNFRAKPKEYKITYKELLQVFPDLEPKTYINLLNIIKESQNIQFRITENDLEKWNGLVRAAESGRQSNEVWGDDPYRFDDQIKGIRHKGKTSDGQDYFEVPIYGHTEISTQNMTADQLESIIKGDSIEYESKKDITFARAGKYILAVPQEEANGGIVGESTLHLPLFGERKIGIERSLYDKLYGGEGIWGSPRHYKPLQKVIKYLTETLPPEMLSQSIKADGSVLYFTGKDFEEMLRNVPKISSTDDFSIIPERMAGAFAHELVGEHLMKTDADKIAWAMRGRADTNYDGEYTRHTTKEKHTVAGVINWETDRVLSEDEYRVKGSIDEGAENELDMLDLLNYLKEATDGAGNKLIKTYEDWQKLEKRIIEMGEIGYKDIHKEEIPLDEPHWAKTRSFRSQAHQMRENKYFNLGMASLIEWGKARGKPDSKTAIVDFYKEVIQGEDTERKTIQEMIQDMRKGDSESQLESKDTESRETQEQVEALRRLQRLQTVLDNMPEESRELLIQSLNGQNTGELSFGAAVQWCSETLAGSVEVPEDELLHYEKRIQHVVDNIGEWETYCVEKDEELIGSYFEVIGQKTWNEWGDWSLIDQEQREEWDSPYEVDRKTIQEWYDAELINQKTYEKWGDWHKDYEKLVDPTVTWSDWQEYLRQQNPDGTVTVFEERFGTGPEWEEGWSRQGTKFTKELWGQHGMETVTIYMRQDGKMVTTSTYERNGEQITETYIKQGEYWLVTTKNHQSREITVRKIVDEKRVVREYHKEKPPIEFAFTVDAKHHVNFNVTEDIQGRATVGAGTELLGLLGLQKDRSYITIGTDGQIRLLPNTKLTAGINTRIPREGLPLTTAQAAIEQYIESTGTTVSIGGTYMHRPGYEPQVGLSGKIKQKIGTLGEIFGGMDTLGDPQTAFENFIGGNFEKLNVEAGWEKEFENWAVGLKGREGAEDGDLSLEVFARRTMQNYANLHKEIIQNVTEEEINSRIKAIYGEDQFQKLQSDPEKFKRMQESVRNTIGDAKFTQAMVGKFHELGFKFIDFSAAEQGRALTMFFSIVTEARILTHKTESETRQQDEHLDTVLKMAEYMQGTREMKRFSLEDLRDGKNPEGLSKYRFVPEDYIQREVFGKTDGRSWERTPGSAENQKFEMNVWVDPKYRNHVVINNDGTFSFTGNIHPKVNIENKGGQEINIFIGEDTISARYSTDSMYTTGPVTIRDYESKLANAGSGVDSVLRKRPVNGYVQADTAPRTAKEQNESNEYNEKIARIDAVRRYRICVDLENYFVNYLKMGESGGNPRTNKRLAVFRAIELTFKAAGEDKNYLGDPAQLEDEAVRVEAVLGNPTQAEMVNQATERLMSIVNNKDYFSKTEILSVLARARTKYTNRAKYGDDFEKGGGYVDNMKKKKGLATNWEDKNTKVNTKEKWKTSMEGISQQLGISPHSLAGDSPCSMADVDFLSNSENLSENFSSKDSITVAGGKGMFLSEGAQYEEYSDFGATKIMHPVQKEFKMKDGRVVSIITGYLEECRNPMFYIQEEPPPPPPPGTLPEPTDEYIHMVYNYKHSAKRKIGDLRTLKFNVGLKVVPPKIGSTVKTYLRHYETTETYKQYRTITSSDVEHRRGPDITRQCRVPITEQEVRTSTENLDPQFWEEIEKDPKYREWVENSETPLTETDKRRWVEDQYEKREWSFEPHKTPDELFPTEYDKTPDELFPTEYDKTPDELFPTSYDKEPDKLFS